MEGEPNVREPPAGPAHMAVTIPRAGGPEDEWDEWSAAACTTSGGGKLTVLAILSGLTLALSVAAVDVLGCFFLALPIFVLSCCFFGRCGSADVHPKLAAIAALQSLGLVWALFYALITIEAVGEIILPGASSVALYTSCVNSVCQDEATTSSLPGGFFDGLGAYYASGALSGVAGARFVVSTSIIITLATSLRGVRAFQRGLPPPPYWLCGC